MANCINYLERELKKIAFSIFNKYPIESYYKLVDVDRLINNDYSILINDTLYKALNAKIAEENGGILFTLATHKDLMKNELDILENKSSIYKVLNLYGENSNSTYVKNSIKQELIKQSDGLEKLLALVGSNSYNERFKQKFETLTSDTQKKLIDTVTNAINRKDKTMFYPDDKIIKNVTPQKEKEIEVFELRLFEPVAIRVYFHETPGKVYFASIEKKPKKKVQDQEIKNAASIIKELIILNE